MQKQDNLFFEQFIPISLTFVVFAALGTLLFFWVGILNRLPTGQHIDVHLRWTDILAGMFIYFKTSVDFAIFIGRLMQSNHGWRKRIAIEMGTALGNGVSTILILSLWVVFRELRVFLAIMILLAALVLFELAQSGLAHLGNWERGRGIKKVLFDAIENFLNPILKFIHPLTSKILPDFSKKLEGKESLAWKSLFFFSLSVPFILGLDDFAGYVPLFSLVNVFGFALGTMAAHMILNIALFLNPEVTVKWIRNQWIAFVGTVVFIALAIFGIIEAVKTLI